jgi:alkaline phosphatase D
MKLPILLFGFFLFYTAQSQRLISGPWAGNVELRTASVWLEVSKDVKKVVVEYHTNTAPNEKKQIQYQGLLGQAFNPVKVELNGLTPNTAYEYTILLDGKKQTLPFSTTFKTPDLWQWRKPAPDFSFLTGSCAYFNEPIYDRPGKSYGQDSSIFETMAKTPADFNIWLGDNWYARESDFGSPWGLNYRASHDRATPVLQAFMASMPQYAIWDDHDFGPNDADKSYIFKEQSRAVFKSYWMNPSFGEKNEGIYTKLSWSDVDFFLLDDRYFRSSDDLPDSINGQPNQEKTFYGKQQLDWLKNALLFSKATFKIIVTGSQALNPLSKYECLQHYPYEYHQLLDFISDQKMDGILFLTGDRHHSEVIRLPRAEKYPLYDITVSPLTSGIGKVTGAEVNNSFREPGTLVEAQNFGRISVSGKKKERMLRIEWIGIKGEILASWSVDEKTLKDD